MYWGFLALPVLIWPAKREVTKVPPMCSKHARVQGSIVFVCSSVAIEHSKEIIPAQHGWYNLNSPAHCVISCYHPGTLCMSVLGGIPSPFNQTTLLYAIQCQLDIYLTIIEQNCNLLVMRNLTSLFYEKVKFARRTSTHRKHTTIHWLSRPAVDGIVYF